MDAVRPPWWAGSDRPEPAPVEYPTSRDTDFARGGFFGTSGATDQPAPAVPLMPPMPPIPPVAPAPGQPSMFEPAVQPGPRDPSGYESPPYEPPSYGSRGYPAPYEPKSYEPQPYDPPASAPPSYEQPSYEAPSYEQPSYEQPVYEPRSYEQPSYEQPSYEPRSYEPQSYEQPSYEQPVYEPQSYESSAPYLPPVYQPVVPDPAPEPEPPRVADSTSIFERPVPETGGSPFGRPVADVPRLAPPAFDASPPPPIRGSAFSNPLGPPVPAPDGARTELPHTQPLSFSDVLTGPISLPGAGRRPAEDPRASAPEGQDAADSTSILPAASARNDPRNTPRNEPRTVRSPGPSSGSPLAPPPARSPSPRQVASPPAAGPTAGRAGRNLPVAIGVGVGLALLILASLFIRPEAFVALVSVVAVLAVWELAGAMATKDIMVPVVPLAVGSVGMLVSAFVAQEEGLLVSFVLTAVCVLLWSVVDGIEGAARDVAAGLFVAAYVPLLAGFAILMLVEGPEWVVVFVMVTVASDIGGYVAGVLAGKHPMAPTVSPKKTWEGFAGSAVACLLVGAVSVAVLLDGPVLAGFALGAAAVVSATLGDLAESMLKRDLNVKDMGTLLPGHGGLMDRLDSLLPTAPVAFLILQALVGS